MSSIRPPAKTHLFIIRGDVRRNCRFGNDQVEDLDAVVAQARNAHLQTLFDGVNDVQEFGVVDLIDGVIGAEDSQFFPDSVKHQLIVELHSVLPDQADQGVHVDI